MKTNSLVGLLAVAGTTSAFLTPFHRDHGHAEIGKGKIHARGASSGWADLFARAFQASGGNGGSTKGGSTGGSTAKGGSNSQTPKSSSGNTGGGAGGAGTGTKPETGGNGAATAAKPSGGSGGQGAAAKPAASSGSEGSSGAAKAGSGAAPAKPAAGGSGAASAKPVAAPSPAASHPAAASPPASHPAQASPLASKPATGGGSGSKGGSPPAANSPAANPAPAKSSPAAGGAGVPQHTSRAKASVATGARQPANSPSTSETGANKVQNQFPTGFGGGAPTFTVPHPTTFPHPTAAPTPTHAAPPPASTPASTCPAVWFQISKDLQALFTAGAGGQCNDMARAVVRMAFHDCGAWEQSLGTSAGCDGSLYLAGEYTAHANAGLEQSVPQYCSMASKYGVGVADFIQFGAAVATLVCPLGPTVKTFVGRPDRSTPNPTYLLPNGTDGGATLVANFAAKGLSAAELVALIGAHTSSKQFEFDPSKSGAPLDDTPGVWDVRFYSEVLEGNAPFILPSDQAVSQYSATAATFKSFVNNQDGWNAAFSAAMTHLSLLGVDTAGLIDCTAALPPPQDNFKEPAGLMTLTEVAKRAIPTGAHYGFHGFHKRYHA